MNTHMRKQRGCLTRQFHVDRAPLLLPSLARLHEYGALGTRSAGVDKMNSSNSNNHVLENIGFLMYLNAHE